MVSLDPLCYVRSPTVSLEPPQYVRSTTVSLETLYYVRSPTVSLETLYYVRSPMVSLEPPHCQITYGQPGAAALSDHLRSVRDIIFRGKNV